MRVREKARIIASSLEGGQPDPSLSGDVAMRPLYDLGQRLRQVDPPELDTAALVAGAVRVREALVSRRPAQAGRPRVLSRLAWAGLAVLLALVVTTTGTALAAESSLPGQPLYPVKRAGEAVRLAWTWQPQGRAALHVEFAERRLAEVTAVCPGGECPAGLLDDLDVQTQKAQEEVERLPAGKNAALLERMVALTAHQEQVLLQVLAAAPDAARPGLERALERSRRGHERAQQALEKEKESENGKKQNAPSSPPHSPKPTKELHGPPQTPPGKGPKQP